jgi:hypothetical protein
MQTMVRTGTTPSLLYPWVLVQKSHKGMARMSDTSDAVEGHYGFSMYRCAAQGCRNNGTNECFSCNQHFCDAHMLQTRLEGTHIGTIVVEACESCTGRAISLYTRQGALMTSCRRKSMAG